MLTALALPVALFPLRYDVQKIEEVLYDMTVRGLDKGAGAKADTDTQTLAASSNNAPAASDVSMQHA